MNTSDYLKCSAVLCVLNEEDRVADGLESIQRLPVEEVIVVDGGSQDETLALLSRFEGITVIRGEKGGLLAQRLSGIRHAKNEVILLLDIDDTIEKTDLMNAFIELTSNPAIDGLQFTLQSDNRSWFAKAWSTYLSLANPPKAVIPLLGRPCLTYRRHYAGLEAPQENILSDDLWLSYNMAGGPKNYVTSEHKTLREFPTSWRSNIQKFVDYGISDYRITITNEKRRELLAHAFWRIAITRTLRCLRPRTWTYAVFPLAHGLVRGFTHLFQIISRFWPRRT